VLFGVGGLGGGGFCGVGLGLFGFLLSWGGWACLFFLRWAGGACFGWAAAFWAFWPS